MNDTMTLEHWVAAFASAFNAADADGVAALFADGECYWRDLLAVSWNIVTVEGRDGVALLANSQAAKIGAITVTGTTLGTVTPEQVEGWFTFETAVIRGKAHVRLRDGLCWTLAPRDFATPAVVDHESNWLPANQADHGIQPS